MSEQARRPRDLVLVYTLADFIEAFGVSRETAARLERYAELLRQWQKAINLVSPRTLSNIWQRHFADSAQLVAAAPSGARRWLDLGSGAGFPGMVIAMLLTNHDDIKVHLIESHGRKCAFLREVARQTAVPVEIHCRRIEEVARAGTVGTVDVVTARALAPLEQLLELAAPFFGPATVGLFLKGRHAEQELIAARKVWRFQWKFIPSRTEIDGSIVAVSELERLEGGGD